MNRPPAAPTGPRIISFVSKVSGTGRTGVLANIATLLAGAGRRVLVIDWRADPPGIDDYLRPFLVETRPTAERLDPGLTRTLAGIGRDSAFPGPQPTASPSQLRRHILPDGERIDVVGPPADAGPRLAVVADRDGEGVRLRQALRRTDYDYVLVECPTTAATAEASLRQLALLCDSVVVCFLPSERSVRDAAEITRTLHRYTAVNLRVIGAQTHLDGPAGWVGQIRSLVRRVFAELLPDVERDVVEIPYRSYQSTAEVLAVAIDDPEQPDNLAAAYRRLARRITEPYGTMMPTVSSVLRGRYRRALGLDPGTTTPTVVVAHTPIDRAWGDWIVGQLTAAGAQAERLTDWAAWWARAPRPSLVVVESADLTPAVVEAAIVRCAGGPPPEQPDVLYVRVGQPAADDKPGQGPRDHRRIDFGEGAADQARAQLLARFALIPPSGPVAERSATTARFPQPPRPDQILRLPARNPTFTGRAEALDRLRDQLLGAPDARITLAGAAGIGKSELVREYAHRFAHDYDVIWWVPAHDRESVRTALGELAAYVDVSVAAGANSDAVTAALRWWSTDDAGQRRLLIYDNLDDPSTVADLLLGAGTGHVLITSRRTEPLPGFTPFPVARFTREEGIRLLRAALPAMRVEDAEAVTDAAARLPLTLRLIVPWLREAVRELSAQGRDSATAAAGAAAALLAQLRPESQRSSPDGPLTEEWDEESAALGRALAATLTAMRGQQAGRVAVRLAEFCSFLAPTGVGLGLLRSAPMLRALAAAAGPGGESIDTDALEFDRVIWTGARYGLFEVDWGTGGALRMHRAVQALLRERMPETRYRERRDQLLAGLAEYAPTDVEEDGPAQRARFEELGRHLVPSGALEVTTRAVRRWVVLQVLHLIRDGDTDLWRSTLDTVQRLVGRWEANQDTADDLWLRLNGHLADLHRLLGDNQRAYELDEFTQREQRRRFGVGHLRTLITGRGKAGDLRGLGEFYEARVEDAATWELLTSALGADHPDTLKAANNLALSSYLMGDVRTAHDIAQDVLRRRRRLIGPAAPLTWSQGDPGTYLRELGRYAEAMQLLGEARDWLRKSARSPHDLDLLQVRRAIAVTRRRMGDPLAAKDDHSTILPILRELLGEGHQEVWACQLALATDLHYLGDAHTAVSLAEDCLHRYEERLGARHPFTGVCCTNLAVFLRDAGRIDEALALGRQARDLLLDRLDEAHPWVLAATVNHANHLVATGAVEEAEHLERTTALEYRQLFGPEHPHTRIARENHQLTLRLLAHDGADGTRRRTIDIDVPQT